MQNFANQCLDLARSLLQQNLAAVATDGTVTPVEGERMRADEPGHVALALGEYHRATNETSIGKTDIVELTARCIRAQLAIREGSDNGLAYACLGLLSFGASKERNLVWDRLDAATRETIAARLAEEQVHANHFQAFDIAKAVCRFSLGMTDKDTSGVLVDRLVDGIAAASSGGYFDDAPKSGNPEALGGCFDLYGLVALVFARQALQLHTNPTARDAKLPKLRTHAEKYVRLLLETSREDGLGWSHGRGIGAYGQMHPVSVLLQALRDRWVPADKEPQARDLVRRLFTHLFGAFIDLEHGVLVIRDAERDTIPGHTTRMANFDASRYLCQWSRLAKTIGGPLPVLAPAANAQPSCRYFPFDRRPGKEQGLCVYSDPASGLHVHLPLVSGGGRGLSDSLAFPHMPGVMDWPVQVGRPCFIPHFRIGGREITPSFAGKNVQVAMGNRGAFLFRYEMPDLMDVSERPLPDLASLRVEWEFSAGKVTGRFTLIPRAAFVLESFRLVLPIAYPHARLNAHGSRTLGGEFHRCQVVRDDLGGAWGALETVSADPAHRTCWGKIHYYQSYERDHALPVRPGQALGIEVSFEPDIAKA